LVRLATGLPFPSVTVTSTTTTLVVVENVGRRDMVGVWARSEAAAKSASGLKTGTSRLR
jgi:hypothetical protein